MLILSRKAGESIIVGDNIKIKICHIDRNTVQVGIDAPESVTIFREELLTRRSPIAEAPTSKVD